VGTCKGCLMMRGPSTKASLLGTSLVSPTCIKCSKMRLHPTRTSLLRTSRVSPPCDTCSLIRLHSTKTSLDGTFRRSPTWKGRSLRRHRSTKISALGGVNYLSRMLRLQLIECLIKAAVLPKTIPPLTPLLLGPFATRVLKVRTSALISFCFTALC
jgi:hypothetical protein